MEEMITTLTFGYRYMSHLLDINEIQKAADLAPKFLGRDAKLWEKWIFKFAKIKQLRVNSFKQRLIRLIIFRQSALIFP